VLDAAQDLLLADNDVHQRHASWFFCDPDQDDPAALAGAGHSLVGLPAAPAHSNTTSGPRPSQ
jgi:hypothetical protein